MCGTPAFVAILVLATLGSLHFVAHAANPEHIKRLKETGNCPKCDLTGADLRKQFLGRDLKNADLAGANLSVAKKPAGPGETIYIRSNLAGVILTGALLQKADLRGADLRKADLSGAKLDNAILSFVQVQGRDGEFKMFHTDFSGARLVKAQMPKVVLRLAILRGANLSKANLRGANLLAAKLNCDKRKPRPKCTNLDEADLRDTRWGWSDLHGASLVSSVLTNARFFGDEFNGANLRNADLTNASLNAVNLSKADLGWAKLTGAKFYRVNLTGARYEPASAPSPGYSGGIIGLKSIVYDPKRESGIILLRAAFKTAGLTRLEREATYVIEKARTSRAGFWERWFKTVLFEFTSDYGLDPGRPLRILMSLIFIFWIVYMFAFRPRSNDGIWRIWTKDRVRNPDPNKETKQLLFVGRRAPYRQPIVGEWLVVEPAHMILIAFQFSLLSAFHFGWRDLNVGAWIARMQPREYALRATGWVRMVSGVQSLTNVYLVALWALTYFGRPFG